MKSLLCILLIAQIILLTSCDKDNDPIQDIKPSEESIMKSLNGFNEVLENSPLSQGDPFDLISALLKKDSSYFTVGYSGGCKTHTFEIIWDEVISGTNLTGINLFIFHHANNDACEAYITKPVLLAMPLYPPAGNPPAGSPAWYMPPVAALTQPVHRTPLSGQ